MSNRRKLKPRELARQDQSLAAARHLGATDQHTGVVAMAYADRDMQCSWCDCPAPVDDPNSPHKDPGYDCGGCPNAARYVLHLMAGTPQEQQLPVCSGHRDDLVHTMQRTFQAVYGPIPTAFQTVPVLDEEFLQR